MTKIKSTLVYVKRSGYEDILYKRALYFPGPLVLGILLEIYLIVGAFAYAMYSAPQQAHAVLAVLAGAALVIAGTVYFVCSIEEGFDEYTWPIYLKYLKGAKKAPVDFDSSHLDHPVYQDALKAHMKGEYVGPLVNLNREISLEKKARPSALGSGYANRLAEQMRLGREAMEEVKSITAGVDSKNNP